MFDQQSDVTQKVMYALLEERPGLSSMVKSAQVGHNMGHLPSTAFADTVGRKFPIDTKANATMSLAYATKVANLDDSITSRLGDAAEVYGILLPPKQQEKVAQEVPRYLLPKQRKFGIKVASDVPLAEKALLRVAPKLSTEDLATASTVLVKAASDSNQEVSQRVMQWAGLVQCDTEKTANWLEARESAGASNGEFTKLASVVRHLDSSNTRSDLVKIAETIGKLDAIYDLQKHYGRKLPNPLETVFSTKTSMEKTLELAGTDVPLKDLMKRGKAFFEDTLGKEIAEEVSTNGKLDETKVVRELPILPADMLKPMLKRMGVSVKKKVTKEAQVSEDLANSLNRASMARYSTQGMPGYTATENPVLDKWDARNKALSALYEKSMNEMAQSQEYQDKVRALNEDFYSSVDPEALAQYQSKTAEQEGGSVVLPAAAGAYLGYYGGRGMYDAATEQNFLKKIQTLGDKAVAQGRTNNPFHAFGGRGPVTAADLGGKSMVRKMRGATGLLGAGMLAGGGYLLNKAYNNYGNN